MKNLEFLPSSYIQRVRNRRMNRKNMGWSVVVVAALLGLHLVNETRFRTVKGALNSLQGDVAEREQGLARLDALTLEKQRFAAQQKLISQLDDDAPLDGVLAEVTRLMTGEMSLCSFEWSVLPPAKSKDPKAPEPDRVVGRGVTEVSLVGKASLGTKVGTFVRQLAGSSLFSDVTLLYSHSSDEDGGAVREFGVSFVVNRIATN